MEYSIIIVILIAVFLSIGHYFKRGLQGKWKAAVDDLGDQYNPRVSAGTEIETITSTQQTIVLTEEGTLENGEVGQFTTRTDIINSVEAKRGSINVGAY